MQAIVKVKRKYNVTIPRKLRKSLPVKVGQLVEMSLEEDRLILKPMAEDPSARLQELIGTLDPKELAKQAEEIVAKEAKSRLAKKLAHR